MFKPDDPPPVQQAQTYAAQLVGADKLQAAFKDPWVQEQILTDCRLHQTNWVACDSPIMPQLILGDAISSGPLNSIPHLMGLLNKYLGMPLVFPERP
jgi:hypothetical protein